MKFSSSMLILLFNNSGQWLVRITKNTGNIGIIASYDPVAIDQCSVDFVAETAETSELRAQWEETHQVKVLEYAEKLGCGKRNYRLVEIK